MPHPTVPAPRLVLPTLLVALLSGCGGPSAPEHQGGGAVMIEPCPDAMEAPGRLEFADLSLHTVAEGAEPLEPWVGGRVLGGLFEPVGEIRGIMDGPPARRLTTRGWLELRTRSFFAANAPRAPRPPYVLGHQDKETGGFYPTSGVLREAAPIPQPPESPEEAPAAATDG